MATTSTTVAPTTTATADVATTTIDPKTKAEADVRAAIDAAVAAFRACVAALPHCDTDTLQATRAGPILETNVARLHEWNKSGYEARDANMFRYVIGSVVFTTEDLTRATVQVCGADGGKLVLPRAGPDGVDVIENDDFVSAWSAWDMRRDPDAAWRVYAAPLVGTRESRDICPSN